jgi:hypothetical protein
MDAFAQWKSTVQSRADNRHALIKRVEQRDAQAGQLVLVPTKRQSKAASKPLRKARAAKFKWAFMSGGSVPFRHKFGMP